MYILSLSGMRDLIEEWTAMGVNADVHEHAVLWMNRRLPADYKTAKKATIDFSADRVPYEHRSRTDSGYFFLYRNVEYECWSSDARHGQYVVIPTWWRE